MGRAGIEDGLGFIIGVGRRGGKFGFAEGIDEIWDKIFLFGAGFNFLFFVFNDNFIVGNFDNFGAWNN